MWLSLALINNPHPTLQRQSPYNLVMQNCSKANSMFLFSPFLYSSFLPSCHMIVAFPLPALTFKIFPYIARGPQKRQNYPHLRSTAINSNVKKYITLYWHQWTSECKNYFLGKYEWSKIDFKTWLNKQNYKDIEVFIEVSLSIKGKICTSSALHWFVYLCSGTILF